MYTKLEISHFKAFSSLTVAPLNRINLIAGDNNIGKTGILEAVYLTHANFDELQRLPYLFRRQQEDVPTTSRDQTDNFWLWLFHKRILDQAWRIALEGAAEQTRGVRGQLMLENPLLMDDPVTAHSNVSGALLKLSTATNGVETEAYYRLQQGLAGFRNGPPPSSKKITAVSTKFSAPSADAEIVNAIAVRNDEDELVEYLRLVEPRLTKLKYLKLPSHKYPYVYADVGFGRGRELIPATQLGQGFARLLSLFATLMVERTQILLIDEFENGLQHDALAPIWKALNKLARKRDIQIFATTHSYECIDAAHEAASEVPDYDLSVIKLRRDAANEVEAVVMDQGMIDTALEQNLEVR